MLALISPAKKLEEKADWTVPTTTQPVLLNEAEQLAAEMKGLSQAEIQKLMKLSDPLGALNYQRYQDFGTPFTEDSARPAVLTFQGDTYVGLEAGSLSQDELTYAQSHLGILSGLYGLLRPLDLMQPYRLEMGTKLTNPRGDDLYSFWEERITQACNDMLEEHKNKTTICLASNEYIKSIQPKALAGDFIICHFKEMKNGAPKVIGLFAKRARGMMARYMIQNKIDQPEGLKDFAVDGYKFQPDLSSETDFVFLRNQE